MHLAKFEKRVCLVSVNSCSSRARLNSKVELDETHGWWVVRDGDAAGLRQPVPE